ncbi:MAG TPA: YoaK family protein [Rhodopila sp.]|nr:YoaK family protein [Rhodopila sp.]
MPIQPATHPFGTLPRTAEAPPSDRPTVRARPAATPFPQRALGPLLAFTGGYVDTAGFLTLQGLFTAHVTGNFVTIGASLLMGTTGSVSKLLALAVFCVVVVAVRMLSLRLERLGHPPLRTLLVLKLLLLIAGAATAIGLGPFSDADAWPAMLTGMLLVSAMAIQNAAHRGHMGAKVPPPNLMTGTTTQIMIDLADLAGRTQPAEQRAEIRGRLARMAASLLLFATGCAIAAVAVGGIGQWCFVVPPLLSLGTLILSQADRSGR